MKVIKVIHAKSVESLSLNPPPTELQGFNQDLKIVLLGMGAVGAKSSLVKQFLTGTYEESYNPTVIDVYGVVLSFERKEYRVIIVGLLLCSHVALFCCMCHVVVGLAVLLRSCRAGRVREIGCRSMFKCRCGYHWF